MAIAEYLSAEWKAARDALMRGPFFRSLELGELGLEHYRLWLRESHYLESAHLAALARLAGALPGRHQSLAPHLLRAALAGPDPALALDDLARLPPAAPAPDQGQALPATRALAAFGFHQIDFGKPLGYLGACLHRLCLAREDLGEVRRRLLDLGVPESALGYLRRCEETWSGGHAWLEEWLDGGLSEEEARDVAREAAVHCRLLGLVLHGLAEEAREGTRVPDWRGALQASLAGKYARDPDRELVSPTLALRINRLGG